MADFFSYTTLAKDTFDSIALGFYHDESLALAIIEANPAYREVLAFQGGEVIRVPVLDAREASTLPPWKRGRI